MSKGEAQTLLSSLSPRDRLELAAWLLESVAHDPDDSVLAESMEIARTRQAELSLGNAEIISEEELWTRVEQSAR